MGSGCLAVGGAAEKGSAAPPRYSSRLCARARAASDAVVYCVRRPVREPTLPLCCFLLCSDLSALLRALNARVLRVQGCQFRFFFYFLCALCLFALFLVGGAVAQRGAWFTARGFLRNYGRREDRGKPRVPALLPPPPSTGQRRLCSGSKMTSSLDCAPAHPAEIFVRTLPPIARLQCRNVASVQSPAQWIVTLVSLRVSLAAQPSRSVMR